MFHFEALKEVKRNIIVDTDIGPDVDDVGALVVLYKLAKKYNIPILGIANCTSNPYGCGAIAAIRKYCGASENIAIGWYDQPGFLYDDSTSTYNKFLTERFAPEYLPQGECKPERALNMYRRLLAAAEDKSVIIVTIGPLNNIGDLLRSQGDKYSPLDGHTLVKEKVHAVVSMGGTTQTKRREYNIVCAGEDSVLFLERMPVPIIFSSYELGAKVPVQFRQIPQNAADNPIYQSYCLYSAFRQWDVCRSAGFDLTAVQFAFEGEGAYYRLIGPGKMTVDVDEEYATQYEVDQDGTHYAMEMVCEPEEIIASFETMVCK